MTRKDYELIAYCIKGELDACRGMSRALTPESALSRLADRFAANLARENPRFDESQFFKACGLD